MIRKCNRDHQRTCNCGQCKVCRNRESKKKHYRKNRERLLKEANERNHPCYDLDEEKLNAYWERERIKDNDVRTV